MKPFIKAICCFLLFKDRDNKILFKLVHFLGFLVNIIYLQLIKNYIYYLMETKFIPFNIMIMIMDF